MKKLEFNKKIAPLLVSGIVLTSVATLDVLYYTYEGNEQIIEQDNRDNIFLDEDGKYKCFFDIGEHKIKVSRNDMLYHKIESVDSYQITEVEINGWRDNNQVTYENVDPVIVVATEKNGKLEFNSFGTKTTAEKTYHK